MTWHTYSGAWCTFTNVIRRMVENGIRAIVSKRLTPTPKRDYIAIFSPFEAQLLGTKCVFFAHQDMQMFGIKVNKYD